MEEVSKKIHHLNLLVCFANFSDKIQFNWL